MNSITLTLPSDEPAKPPPEPVGQFEYCAPNGVGQCSCRKFHCDPTGCENAIWVPA